MNPTKVQNRQHLIRDDISALTSIENCMSKVKETYILVITLTNQYFIEIKIIKLWEKKKSQGQLTRKKRL